MAASANPSSGAHSNASNGNNNSGNSKGGGGQENANGGGGLSATENSVVGPTQAALRHNPGLSVDWTPEEQSILEDLLVKYASETVVVRYAKIAQALRDKTVRDVALRCRWMSKKENGKRRKDDSSLSRKIKKKGKVTDSLPKSSQVANRSNGPTYVQSMIYFVSYANDKSLAFLQLEGVTRMRLYIGGAAGQLLEQSAHALDQISANFSACKLYLQNLVKHSVVIDLNDTPEIMKQMPPLPVKLNEELANSILPRASLPKKS
ncbi:hypothetical protein Sango_0455300 [Sesamum angolense]|uniref:Myb-like domain-containing protein n=1 Tax=Sesamum angolense TaxID=2727404 RepID=A0AAE1XBD9_9LAMI|nr:hypothetical protein Sango_0455300 [Sesamum angolense]